LPPKRVFLFPCWPFPPPFFALSIYFQIIFIFRLTRCYELRIKHSMITVQAKSNGIFRTPGRAFLDLNRREARLNGGPLKSRPGTFLMGPPTRGAGLTTEQRHWRASAKGDKRMRPGVTGCSPPGQKNIATRVLPCGRLLAIKRTPRQSGADKRKPPATAGATWVQLPPAPMIFDN